jgi:hypothetical protein
MHPLFPAIFSPRIFISIFCSFQNTTLAAKNDLELVVPASRSVFGGHGTSFKLHSLLLVEQNKSTDAREGGWADNVRQDRPAVGKQDKDTQNTDHNCS